MQEWFIFFSAKEFYIEKSAAAEKQAEIGTGAADYIISHKVYL